MLKPARIVIDHFYPRVLSWCWRDDWNTGIDSIYGLFAKFSQLNAIGAQEIARIFVNRTCGQRNAIAHNPNVDLRNIEVFDIVEIARIFRLDIVQVRNAFLFECFPNSRRKSSDHLRWCSRCAVIGFHTPVFQLEILTHCPIHNRPLRTQCSNCLTQIPYRLRREVFSIPFVCPTCGVDFAPALRNPKTKSLELCDASLFGLKNLVSLFKFEDYILPVKFELNWRRKLLGIGEVVLASADWRRLESQYTGFVTHVLDDLRPENDAGQLKLGFEDVSTVERGTIAKLAKGNTAKKKSKQRGQGVGIVKVDNIKHSWDDRLQSIYTLYSSLRRHLWRHIVREHQHCIAAAGQHLWWYMEGEKTDSFCPVAEAFLRWRMYWEGCGVPRSLFAPISKNPFGLIGWLAESAPVCPHGWSKDADLWVSDHIFAKSCLGSFHDWLDISLENEMTGRILWNRHSLTGKHESYWAVSGHDSLRNPVRIYTQCHQHNDYQKVLECKEGQRQHRQKHRLQLNEIFR